MNLPEFSVRNSIFGNMLTIVVLVVGLIAAVVMPRELFPETDLDRVMVRTVYRNASPAEIEDQVTIPLEDEIRGLDGIEEFTSTSLENASTILVEIDQDADNKDRVINDISRRVDRVRDLPAEAEDPSVEVLVTRTTAIHVLVEGTADETRLRDFADRIKSRIEGVPGVSTVDLYGWRDPEIWVEVDGQALLELELSLQQVADSLSRQNVNLPGGKVPSGSREVVLRSIGQFRTPEEIRQVVVRANPDGRRVTVGDVATVTATYAEDMVRFRANGSRAIMLSVNKKDSGDTIEIAEAVRQLVEDERAVLPEGIRLGIIDMESYLIKRRLNVLLGNGLAGLVLVLLALPLLLNVRVALVTALGIPFAFLMAVLVMSIMGVTINMMTMFGIILVIGMLVDDAIIVAENIYAYLEQGMQPTEAAVRGASEVMWPVTSTVLTTIAAFFPLLFLPDMMGKFLRWVPMVVIITLSASLLEALVILPSHVAGLARGDPHRQGGGDGARLTAAARWSARLQDGYEVLLRRALHHRVLLLAGLVAALAGAVLLGVKALRVDIFPADLIDMFQVNITMPQGTSLDATEEAVTRVEAVLQGELAADELSNLTAEVGRLTARGAAGGEADARYGSVVVYLTPANKRQRQARELIAALRPLCEAVPGVERVELEMIKPGPPVGKEVDIRVIGRDLAELDAIAGEVKAFLPEVGAVDIYDDYEPGKEELRLLVNKAEAGRLGVDATLVAQAVYTGFQGLEATVIRDAHEETKVRVKLAEPYRDRVEWLRRLTVPNRSGRLVPLERVVDFETGQGVTGIRHVDGERVVSVLAAVDRTAGRKVSAASIAMAVQRRFADLHLTHPGYRIDFGGEWESTRDTIRSMVRALVIALLLIYAILVVQFKSFLQPFTVLVSIPFGMIGVVIALVLHGKPLSMMAMLGMVGMTGVVVNDAIVLVSFINDLRRGGMPVFEAIIQGARRRVRPFLLTSVTTVLGLAPVIYGIGGYEPFVAPAAIVLAYGLVFATFLTLMVVPCLYSLGADLKRRLGVSLLQR